MKVNGQIHFPAALTRFLSPLAPRSMQQIYHLQEQLQVSLSLATLLHPWDTHFLQIIFSIV
jgi:hypothetical protein